MLGIGRVCSEFDDVDVFVVVVVVVVVVERQEMSWDWVLLISQVRGLQRTAQVDIGG